MYYSSIIKMYLETLIMMIKQSSTPEGPIFQNSFDKKPPPIAIAYWNCPHHQPKNQLEIGHLFFFDIIKSNSKGLEIDSF